MRVLKDLPPKWRNAIRFSTDVIEIWIFANVSVRSKYNFEFVHENGMDLMKSSHSWLGKRKYKPRIKKKNR